MTRDQKQPDKYWMMNFCGLFEEIPDHENQQESHGSATMQGWAARGLFVILMLNGRMKNEKNTYALIHGW